MTAFKAHSIKNELNLVLLGVGGSGKTTLFKQLMCGFPHSEADTDTESEEGEMDAGVSTDVSTSLSRLLASPRACMGFSVPDLKKYKREVRKQLIGTCKQLIAYAQYAAEGKHSGDDHSAEGMRSFDLIDALSDAQRRALCIPPELAAVTEAIASVRCLEDAYRHADDIIQIWEQVLSLWFLKRCSLKLDVEESSGYVMSRAADVLSGLYQPTKEDVCRVRHRSSGQQTRAFSIEGKQAIIHDVGGIADERKKTWEGSLSMRGLNAVVYCVALTSYCHFQFDSSQNCLQESIAVWQRHVNDTDTCNATVPFVLMLTHYDALAATLRKQPLSAFVSEFDGDDKVWLVAEFIKEQFLKQVKCRRKVVVFLVNGLSEVSVCNVFGRCISKVSEHWEAISGKCKPPPYLL